MSWPLISIGSVAKVAGGYAFKSQDFEEIGSPIVRISNVKNGVVDLSKAARIPDEKLEKGKKFRIEAGSLLIAMSGATTGKVGRYFPIDEQPAYLNQRVGKFECNKSLIDQDYLWFFTQSDICQKQISFLAEGAAQPNISGSQIESIKIPLPPLETQKQIAAVLEKADQLRKDCQQMEQELNSLAQSVFIEMFGDPVTNPKGWDKAALSELVNSKDDIKCGPFGTQLGKSEFTIEGVPLWGIRHVNSAFRKPTVEFVSSKKAKDLAAYSIEAGDIVMTRKGNVGNCYIYPDDLESGIMHSDLLRIRSCNKRINSKFLQKQFMYSQDVEGQLRLISQGAIMAGINVTKLKSLVLLSPPLKVQEKYADILDGIETQKDLLELKLADSIVMFNALMQKAFNGELNLDSAKTQ